MMMRCSRIPGRANRWRASMAGRCARSSPSSISGRARNGSGGSSLSPRIAAASGKSAAITIAAIPGASSVTAKETERMRIEDGAALDHELRRLLGLAIPPIAIGFAKEVPASLPRPAQQRPSPTADGRTGAVAAGCVFWMAASERSFATTAEDHGNCSVGSFTHGFKSFAEAAAGADVAALLASEWVTAEAASRIPAIKEKPGAVLYGPLAQGAFAPDVVFLRLNGKQLMLVHDAWPELRFEGKPQCHIIPIAREEGAVAAS